MSQTLRSEESVEHRILAALEPLPGRPWSEVLVETRTDGLYPVLIGAAASLIQFSRLHEMHAAGDWKRYSLDGLHEELKAAVVGDSLVDWKNSPAFLVWSTGFFINRAQHNIAAAFDRCLTAWVTHRLGIDLDAPAVEDIWIGSWPIPRLHFLKLNNPQAAIDVINDLIMAFSDELNLGNDQSAQKHIKNLAHNCLVLHRSGELTLENAFKSHFVVGGSCIAIVCGRTNSFKHRIRSKEAESDEEIGRQYRLLAEFVVTTRAYLAVCSMFKTMLCEMIDKKAAAN